MAVGLKMDSGDASKNCYMSYNCQILICSPLKMKSLHLLSKFRGQIFNGLGEK